MKYFWRRILSAILVFMLVLSMMPVMPISAQAASESDLTFELNSDGQSYSVVDCIESASGALTIPAAYNGKLVTGIGGRAFNFCDKLTSITIPDSVSSIGDYAFTYCTNLTSITIPGSVISIGDYAFKVCRNLTDITIPDNVTSIGDSAFYDCDNLTSVTIGKGVTSIGSNAFRDCYSLSNVIIPNSVTSIGDRAFYDCTNLTGIIIPDSVISIGVETFALCTSLSSITIPKSVTQIGDRAFVRCDNLTTIQVDEGNLNYTNDSQGILYNKDKTILLHAPGAITLCTVPDGVTSIGGYAFMHCESLASVAISGGVTSIGDGAFSNCYKLKSIMLPKSVTTIRSYAFSDCDLLSTVWYTGSEAQANAIVGKGSLNNSSWHYNTCAVHSYASDCDTACEECDWTREVNTNHTYDNNCDAICNLCGFSRSSEGHSFTAACDIFCNACGFERIPVSEHKYDNTCDTTCNACGDVRTPAAHVYAADCDTICNICLSERSAADHTFDDNADHICNLCDMSVPYTIIFDANGGESQPAPQSKEYGETIHLTGAQPYRNGHIFSGWSTTPRGEVVYKANSEYSKNERIVLYAQWVLPCDACNAKGMVDGEIFCLSCLGTGQYEETCVTCRGLGFVQREGKCPISNCYSGWLVDINGDTKRCGYCGGDGLSLNTEDCSECAGGKNTYDCFTCGGDGYTIGSKNCSNCNGTGGLPRVEMQTPPPPTLASKGATTITLSAMTDCEYSMDGNTWQKSPVFTNLQAFTDYRFYARYIGTSTRKASQPSQAAVFKTELAEQLAPSAPVVLTVTDNMVILEEVSGHEYSIDGNSWQTSGVFTDLSPATAYSFYARKAATDSQLASPASAVCTVETLAIYTVVFQNYDGTILSTEIYHYGDAVIEPTIPTKPSDNTYMYVFAGWDKPVVDCAGDTTYTATYTAHKKPVVTVTIDGEHIEYTQFTEAINDAPAGSTLLLIQNIEEDVVISKNLVLDLNGFDITGNITVTSGAAFSVKDSQTDDYTIEDSNGYGKIIGTISGVQAKDGYMMITEPDGISFHRIDLQLTDMTLRSSAVGVYYKCNFAGDEIIAQHVDHYGVALSVDGEPTDDALGICSWYDSFIPGNGGNSANGTLLHGIMKTTNTESVNAENAKMAICGRAYILTKDGQYIFGECVSRSFREQVELIDCQWNELTSEQQLAVLNLYQSYESILSKWDIPNILAA